MPHNLPINDWRGKTVWLVGASTGIGRATAHALHARGAKVIVSARNQQALDVFAAEHPGATVLAVTPSAAWSTARARARPSMPAFAAAYAASPRIDITGPVTDETMTTRPHPAACMPGITRCTRPL